MKRFRNVLTVLGLNDKDAATLAWASHICRQAQPDEVRFIHVAPPLDIPATAREKYPWLEQPLESVLRERLRGVLAHGWPLGVDTPSSQRVRVEQSPVLGVLREVQEMDADLVVVGKEGTDAEMAVRLARKSSCSVLMVPEDATAHVQAVGVGVDFSRFSPAILETAAAYAVGFGLREMHVAHVYEVLYGHPKDSVPYDTLAELTEADARARMVHLLKDASVHGLKVHEHYLRTRQVGSGLTNFARGQNIGLLVIGARGRDALADLLLGGEAESVLTTASMAVLAVKQKGTGRDFLASLLHD